MKRNLFLAVITFLAFSINAFSLDYTISFTGNGASASVDNVVVQNLTKSTEVIVPTGNTLHLTDVVTAIASANAKSGNQFSCQKLSDSKVKVTFAVQQAGAVHVNVFGINGSKVAAVHQSLQQGTAAFELTLPSGIFMVQVSGKGFSYSGKISNQTTLYCNPTIALVSSTNQQTTQQQRAKNNPPSTEMTYTTGDLLLYKATSGNYITIVTDVPSVSKSTNFTFVACQDASLNNYPVVTIGTQTWIAENLKTTKYRNADLITNTTDNTEWAELSTGAWSDYDNDAANGIKYGHHYNWYAVTDARNIAPIGWHVATNAEWTTLANYVASNLGTSTSVNKALATTTDWSANTGTNTIGNDLTLNNSTGFSALPGAFRSNNGVCGSIVNDGDWWTATESDVSNAWFNAVNYNSSTIYNVGLGKNWGLSVRCVLDYAPSLASTTTVTAITATTATSGGNVILDNGGPVTARGVCWSTTTAPLVSGSHTTDAGTTGTFSSSITGLTGSTTYYVRAYATNYMGTNYGAEVSFTTSAPVMAIGDLYLGGKIAYILQSGDPGYDDNVPHGIIAAPSDLTAIRWRNTYTTTGATATALGTGNANTNTIVTNQGAGNYAAKLCADLEVGGYSDWYLPSKDELNKLYLNSVAIGDFNLWADYWSSTESSSTNAWRQYFNDGSQVITDKGLTIRARAVRAF